MRSMRRACAGSRCAGADPKALVSVVGIWRTEN
jgi:hypothetical protein